MSSSSSSPPPPQAAAASSSTSIITKGSIVTVESRTWPGLNKPGGVARVTHVHHNYDTDNNNKITYDVAYVLGGKEKAVGAEYVTLQSADDDGDGAKKKRTSAGGGLTISTSTASLALSATPLQTPRSPKSSEKATNNNNDNDDSDGTPIDDNEEQIIEERRKRKNSITENILMGMTAEGESIEMRDDSRNSSYSELPTATAADDAPLVKKMKLETSEQQHHDKTDDESSSMSLSSLQNHHKTAIWSARKNLEIRVPAAGRTADDSNNTAITTTTTTKRWRSHQIAEDYITLASALVLPPPTTSITYGYSPHFGQYPIEQMTALGYLTSPLRRPTIIEKWSPYEIATFEASMALHGKHFHIISKFVKTKSTKEIIEFYYIWKKTSHYRRWKNGFEDEICESVDGSSSEEEENDDGGGDEKGGDDKK